MNWRISALFFCSLLARLPLAAEERDPMLLVQTEGWTLRAHLQVGSNLVSEQNLFWNFAATVAPDVEFDPDTEWLEAYVEPGLSFEKKTTKGSTLYGKVSVVASSTLGTDAYDTGDTGRLTLEEAALGFRGTTGSGNSYDLSLGAQDLKLGTGMLIANGGSSGFERGAIKLGPRKAWERTAIGKWIRGPFEGALFYLDANELPSNDSETKLVGLDLRWGQASGDFAGLTYAHITHSEAPYPQAAPGGVGPPTVTPGAREGLDALNVYARAHPFEELRKEFFIAGDLAYEWNDRIDLSAWAGRIQVGHTFSKQMWQPLLMYSWATFSGDDPDTASLERFDPLFYEGSPSSWATGSKSSMVFINSNVQAHQVSLAVRPTPRDTLTFRFAHIRVNELRSPVQFGQATRIDFSSGVSTVISGVTASHLVDDFFIEYNHAFEHVYLTAGASLSLPGAGIDSVLDTDAPSWFGGFLNVVFNY